MDADATRAADAEGGGEACATALTVLARAPLPVPPGALVPPVLPRLVDQRCARIMRT